MYIGNNCMLPSSAIISQPMFDRNQHLFPWQKSHEYKQNRNCKTHRSPEQNTHAEEFERRARKQQNSERCAQKYRQPDKKYKYTYEMYGAEAKKSISNYAFIDAKTNTLYEIDFTKNGVQGNWLTASTSVITLALVTVIHTSILSNVVECHEFCPFSSNIFRDDIIFLIFLIVQSIVRCYFRIVIYGVLCTRRPKNIEPLEIFLNFEQRKKCKKNIILSMNSSRLFLFSRTDHSHELNNSVSRKKYIYS